ncbi:MAG: hypothetical protein ABJ239_01615 [Erythrobacter sp.]
MTRLLPNAFAAFAAVLIVSLSMSAVITVPPVEAATTPLPELA